MKIPIDSLYFLTNPEDEKEIWPLAPVVSTRNPPLWVRQLWLENDIDDFNKLLRPIEVQNYPELFIYSLTKMKKTSKGRN